jgi:hypothetical protein
MFHEASNMDHEVRIIWVMRLEFNHIGMCPVDRANMLWSATQRLTVCGRRFSNQKFWRPSHSPDSILKLNHVNLTLLQYMATYLGRG